MIGTEYRKEKLLAGKSGSGGEELWLPLWMHLRDTAEMMRLLVQRWLPPSVRTAMQLEEETLSALAVFLGAVHDIGKASALFQSRILLGLPEARTRLEAVCPLPASFLYPGKTPHARAGEAILLSLGCSEGLASAVGAHHGKPQENSLDDYVADQLEEYPANYWGKGPSSFWRAAWKTFYGEALRQSGLTQEDLPDLPLPALLLLTGLLIMADWIASNPYYFPLLPVSETGEESACPERARRAWELLRLTFPWEGQVRSMGEEAFRLRFGFAPNAVQRAVMDTASQMETPGLLILEAQMGVGKTEAALAAAELFSARFGAGGLMFGLPTQATANGMFPRLEKWSLMQSEETVHSIRLAHGMAALNESYCRLMEGSAVTQDGEDGGLLVHSWFQGNKQALLANFVVGTVDQILLAALRQKHLMLRHLGLAGKVVVVDECHAYDAYMNRYLDRALAWLGRYRVPVILLSATLPARRRSELVEAYLGKQQPDAPWKTCRSYPLLTWTSGGEAKQRAVVREGGGRGVQIRFAAETDVPAILRERLRCGGCAGVVVNTVRKAQRLASSLRDCLPDKEVVLFHAQFVQPDRAAIENALLMRVGKTSTRKQRDGLIVVGTQVMEQSLDLDFDLLLTELCPMDLLLQRVGRLHRHARTDRPEGLREAVCVVMKPPDGRQDEGSLAVYGAWLLWRTERLLPDHVSLPEDIPRLVQDVYGWETEDCLPESEESLRAREAFELRQREMENRAGAFVILPPRQGSSVFGPDTLDDWMRETAAISETAAQAAVRDGDPSIDVLVMVRGKTGTVHFLPWQEGGASVAADRPPSREEARRIARQKLRLPGVFSRKWRIDRVIRELEDVNRRFLMRWQEAPLLRGELVLLLDEDLTASLAQTGLRYSREDGLTVEGVEHNERNRI